MTASIAYPFSDSDCRHDGVGALADRERAQRQVVAVFSQLVDELRGGGYGQALAAEHTYIISIGHIGQDICRCIRKSGNEKYISGR